MTLEKSFYRQFKASTPGQFFFKYSGMGPLRTLVRWFGLSVALKIIWRKWLSIEDPVKVYPPGIKTPVFLRATTTDPFVYSEILYERIYDVALPDSARLIIDAGANIGLTSVFFSDRYPSAQIIAIEPSTANMDMLRRNVASRPGIHPKLAGLWPCSGPLCLVNPDTQAWATQVRPCLPEEADFQGITIPEILAECGATQIDLLKIDIEGSEWPLLFDSTPDWLRTVNYLAIELHERPGRGSFDQVVQLLDTYQLRLVGVVSTNYFFTRS